MKQPVLSYVFYMTVCVCFLSSQAYAGKIYSWTDENGVKQYSNTEPGGGVSDVEITDEMPADPRYSDKNQERQKIIDGLKSRNQAAEDERKIEEQKREAKKSEEKAKTQKKMDGKVQAEKNRLLAEIKTYELRAVGPTYSLALKNSIIQKLKDKLALLEESPEKYFENQGKE
jgi:Domain of unknown function (DUF4124)